MSKKKARRRPRRKPKRKQPRTLFYGVLTVVVIAAALYGGYAFLKSRDEALAGTRMPDQGRGHIPACQPGRYNSTPPTSGCHSPSTAPWGISDQPVPDELQVHNLEHGGVLIHYRPNPVPGLGDDYIEELRAFVREKRQDRRYCKLLLAPYPGLNEPIALTAWNWILTLDAFDEELIMKFINDHIERGPERGIPCR